MLVSVHARELQASERDGRASKQIFANGSYFEWKKYFFFCEFKKLMCHSTFMKHSIVGHKSLKMKNEIWYY